MQAIYKEMFGYHNKRNDNISFKFYIIDKDNHFKTISPRQYKHIALEDRTLEYHKIQYLELKFKKIQFRDKMDINSARRKYLEQGNDDKFAFNKAIYDFLSNRELVPFEF